MKSLINYINENKQINESKGVNELIDEIKKANIYDFIPYLWGVVEDASKPSGIGACHVEPVIHIEKRKNGKFILLYAGHTRCDEMVHKALKKSGMRSKLQEFLGIGLMLTEEQVIKLIDVLPKYFSEYSGSDKFIQALSFDYDDIYKICATISKPYKVKTLEDEIKSIENQMKQLDDKKSQLEKLKNSKDDE